MLNVIQYLYGRTDKCAQNMSKSCANNSQIEKYEDLNELLTLPSSILVYVQFWI